MRKRTWVVGGSILSVSLAYLLAVPAAYATPFLFTGAGAGMVALTVGVNMAGVVANNDSITAPSSADVAIAFGNTGGAGFTSTGPATFTGAIYFSDAANKTTGGSCPANPGGVCKVDSSSSLSNTTVTGVTAFNPAIPSAAVTEWTALTSVTTGWGSVPGTAVNLGSGGKLCVGSGGSGCTATAPTTTTLIINGMSQTAYVFNITSSGGHINGPVTIQGDNTGNAMVILNYGGTQTLQTNQQFTLAGGLLRDQVLMNVTSTGGMQTSGGFGFNGALAVTGSTINLDASTLSGRLFLNGNVTGSIQSNFSLTAPPDIPTTSTTPETRSAGLFAVGMLGMIFLKLRR
jgi:hypothetical protein